MTKLEQVQELLNQAEELVSQFQETGDEGIIQRAVRAAAARVRVRVHNMQMAQPTPLFEGKDVV